MQRTRTTFSTLLAALLLLALSAMTVAAQSTNTPPTTTPSASAPTITSLSQTTAVAGSGAFTLTVTGTNFVSTSRVIFGNTALTPDATSASATSLTVTVPATAISHPRTLAVLVYNGHRSLSNPEPFQVTPSSPPPTITSLSPATAVAGSADLPLTITGTDFLATSTVYFGRTALTPDATSASATSLTVTVPAASLKSPGHVSVVVSNGPTSGSSAPTAFTITPANQPTITSLDPTTVVAGSDGFTLTVTGTNFVAGSRVYFGDSALVTTYVSATSLTAAVPTSALARPRSAAVVVYNGRSNGGASSSVTFQITPASPPPTVTGLSPATAVAGSGSFLLTVTGTNFLSTSVVSFGGTTLTPDPTTASATSLTVTVPATAVAYARTVPVVVSNGASSGHSAPTAFTVTPPTAQVFYQIGKSAGAASAGLAVAYNVTGLPAGTTLDLTQPVSLMLSTTALPAVQFYATGSLTLTQKTIPGQPAGGTTSLSYYQAQGTDLTLTVIALPDGEYRVYLAAKDVDLSQVDTTQPVTVTLGIGGQTFAAQAQPVSPTTSNAPQK